MTGDGETRENHATLLMCIDVFWGRIIKNDRVFCFDSNAHGGGGGVGGEMEGAGQTEETTY